MATLDNDDIATLAKELSWLSKREGFVPQRLPRAGIVDEVLRGSLQDSFERLQHRFISAIHTLPTEQAELLLDVFALSPETQNLPELTQRRSLHGAKIGRQIDTVRTRERAALTALHSRLVTGRYAQAPLAIDVPEMHDGIIFEEVSILTIVENRAWRETHENHRFILLSEEIKRITIGRSYPAHVQTPTSSPFHIRSRSVPGAGWNDHFMHKDPDPDLAEDIPTRQPYDLRFRLTPDAEYAAPDTITLGSRALHHRALLFNFRVRFIGERPATIWRFEGASPFARPHAANAHNRAELGDDGAITMTLRDVHGGLFNGFGWEWSHAGPE